MSARIDIVLLAAGLSTRMGGENKLLMDYRAKPLVRWAAEAASASKAARVHLVTGRDGERVAYLCEALPRIVRTQNPAPHKGLSSSLLLGLRAAKAADGVVVMLGDMPDITTAHVDALIDAFDENAFAHVLENEAGAIGNPVMLGKEAMAACACLTGDQGARALLQANEHRLKRVRIDDPAMFRDLDTRADFSD
jgi:molybdenum cofactor cytidylyltransferase